MTTDGPEPPRTRGKRPGLPTPALTEEYRRTGFLVVRGLCTLEEIRAWQKECRRLWSEVEVCEHNCRLQWRGRLDGSRVADRIDPVLDISPVFTRLAGDPRFAGAAAYLVGGDVDVFKAKLITKWPGTMGYRLHQDYPYWSFVGNVPFDDFVNVLVPIDRFDVSNGALEVFPGYHDRRLEGPADEPRDVDESQVDPAKAVLLALDPGDVALFHGMTPHRSGPNRSKRNRESLFITYVRAGHGDLYERYYRTGPDF